LLFIKISMSADKYIKDNPPKIDFFGNGNKNFILARFLFEYYVIPTKYFEVKNCVNHTNCMNLTIENKEVVDNGHKQYHFDDFKRISETEIFIDPKYIIYKGKFLDVTKLCEKNKIFISDDESMIDTAFRSFENVGGNLMQSNRIITIPKIYEMPLDYYDPRTYTSLIFTSESVVGVGCGDKIKCENEMSFYKLETILGRLKSGKYISNRDYAEGEYSIRDDSILLDGKIFSGRFLQKLMVGEEKVSPVKINFGSTRHIIASYQDNKKTITIFSDFAIEVSDSCENSNSGSSFPSTYNNILMRKNQDSTLINCSGKLREIKDSEILSNIPLNKNTFVLILGVETMTEILVIYKLD
jgi:hypothetical protein